MPVNTNLGSHEDLRTYQAPYLHPAIFYFLHHPPSEERDIAIADMCNSLGNDYTHNGNYDLALAYYLMARNVYVTIFREEINLAIAIIYKNLGIAYGNLKDFKQQITLSKKALAAFEFLINLEEGTEVRLELTIQMVETLDILGNGYMMLHRYYRAREYYNRALEIAESNLGTSHLTTAIVLSNLGCACDMRGYICQRIEYQTKALEVMEQILGPLHPLFAMTLNNLGVAYGAISEYEIQQNYQEQALDILIPIFGEHDVRVRAIIANLQWLSELSEVPVEEAPTLTEDSLVQRMFSSVLAAIFSLKESVEDMLEKIADAIQVILIDPLLEESLGKLEFLLELQDSAQQSSAIFLQHPSLNPYPDGEPGNDDSNNPFDPATGTGWLVGPTNDTNSETTYM